MKRDRSLWPGALLGALLILSTFTPMFAAWKPTISRPNPGATKDAFAECFFFPWLSWCAQPPPPPQPKPAPKPKPLEPDVPDEEPAR